MLSKIGSKTESGRRLDMIGWVVDLDLRSVSIAKHNFLKTFYGFMSCDETKKMEVKEIEKLASWASRYGAICTSMQPFVKDLYAEIAGRHRRAMVQLGENACRCVRLWRSTLIALELNEFEYSRPLESFGVKDVEYLIEYDASLKGAGILIIKIDGDRNETVVKAAKIRFPFDLHGNSGYQNTVEFIAVVMGLGCLASLGVRNLAVGLRGDNTSSLSWSLSHRFADGYSRRAAVAFVSISEVLGLRVDEGEHIAGVLNVRCDRLSRNGTFEEWGFSGDDILHWELDNRLVSLLSACAPDPVIATDEDIAHLWRLNHAITSEFLYGRVTSC